MPDLKKVFTNGTKQKRQQENARTLDEFHSTSGATEGYLEADPSVYRWLKAQLPTGPGVLNYLISLFPFSKWIFSYNLQWLAGDIIAGVTVGLVVIPQGMAYAKLAQLPVQYGLYTSFMGALVYWIFGTSKDVNIGPVAVASMVIGTIVIEARETLPDYQPWVVASTLALISGCVITIIGLLRLGWLVDLIALPAVSGFITGAAITICLGQIPTMLGIKGIDGSEAAFKVLASIIRHIKDTRWDAVPGISALILLYVIKFACQKAARRWPKKSKPIFFANAMRTIFTLVLFTIISYGVNKDRKVTPMFKMLGFIPSGFRNTAMPKVDAKLVQVLLPQVPAMLIVLLIEHISIAKSFGRINNYTINPSQEIVAIGVANLLGPFLGAYAATGSLSRTAIKAKAGVRTPFAGVITAGIVLLAIYELTTCFYWVPTSSLAAVIIHAIGDILTPISTLKIFWRVSPTDLIIFMVGTLTILFSSIEHGIFAMVAMSLALLLIRSFKSHGHFLGVVSISGMSHRFGKSQMSNGDEDNLKGPSLKSGRVESKSLFVPLNRYDGSNPNVRIDKPDPGVFVYRFAQDFNYTNANHYMDQLTGEITRATRPTTLIATDKPGDRPWNNPAPRWSRKGEAQVDHRPTLKAIILDMSAVFHVDVTSVQLLVDARNLLDRHAAPRSVQWHFACIHNGWTKRALAAAGFGYPSHDAEDKQIRQWQGIYSIADTVAHSANNGELIDEDHRHTKDIEMADWHDAQEFVDQKFSKTLAPTAKGTKEGEDGDDRISVDKTTLTMTEVVDTNTSSVTSRKATLHGVNRPFFHADLEIALENARMAELD